MLISTIRRCSRIAALTGIFWPALLYAGGSGELRPTEFRAAVGLDNFDRTWQVAAVFRAVSPKSFRAHHLEIATGVTASGIDARPFLSAGPVWRFSGPRRFFLEVGFSPTLLGGPRYQGCSLGGILHFTSSASIAWDFGRGGLISLRIQHTSNGSIRSVNPGLNMVGLTITRRISI